MVRDALSGEWSVAAAPGAPDELLRALNGPIPEIIEHAGGWSIPIASPENGTIGSLTVYRLKGGEPTAREEQILAAVSDIAGIAIEQHRAARTPGAVEGSRSVSTVPETRDLDNLSFMAGSIAHEYNNLLAVIVGNADLAIESGNLEPPAANWIADIQKASKRASELTRQLQEFAGKEISCLETIDLPAFVADIAEHLRGVTSREIDYQCLSKDESIYVSGDVLRIREIVTSLAGIAREAVDAPSDTIHIRTGVFTADKAYLRQSYYGDELTEGDYVFVEVQRPGHEMTNDDLLGIRDPFFVPNTGGRSMGLTSALGNIKRHGGALHIDNDPLKGPTLRALFPRRILATASAVSDATIHERSSTGTVLVVDDEPMVVSVAEEMLSGQGLHVLTAYSGEHGLSIARQNIDEIDAVVLDATMDDLSGEDTFQALRKMRDDLPVIFCSGQPETYCLNLVEGRELTGFVSKPFKSSVLYETVQNLIELREQHKEVAVDDNRSAGASMDKSMRGETPRESHEG